MPLKIELKLVIEWVLYLWHNNLWVIDFDSKEYLDLVEEERIEEQEIYI